MARIRDGVILSGANKREAACETDIVKWSMAAMRR